MVQWPYRGQCAMYRYENGNQYKAEKAKLPLSLTLLAAWVDESDWQGALCKPNVAAFHLLVVLSHLQVL